jgi:hypothetical protein
MTRFYFLGAGFVLGLFLLGTVVVPSSDRPQTPPFPAATPPDSGAGAVVELFTSEGCSSCPPADRVLRSLVDEARTHDRPVYALSFHVDYWNQLGWEDPYSKSAFSERQGQYSRALGVDTYTPQIVVNGRQAMVGSRVGQVRSAIESALDATARVDVDLSAEGREDDLAVTYQLDGPLPEDATLRIAVVERGLSQDVSRGENAGRTLQHANVVRAFETVSARPSGTAEVEIPEAVDRSRASVIGYVQSPSLAVLGAARVDLKEG